ncbi:unnamed protein product [Staurois parvus]|uniref:Uncharacterized protein n=1 Tax=Staurois parvus TaxID=386267 RepID=A0ABN9G768_9NEOB|nr:unnamed protein product [Staurois parvus]
MLYDRAIVIQSVRALKPEKWPGQEGVKLHGIKMVKGFKYIVTMTVSFC